MKKELTFVVLGLMLSGASHCQQAAAAPSPDPVGGELCRLTIMRQASEQGGALSDDEVRYVNAYLQARGLTQLQEAMAIDPTATILSIVSKTCKQGMTLRQSLDALGTPKA